MGLVAGDVCSVTYEATYDSQQIRYVLHYQVVTPGSSTTPEGDLDAMAANFGNNTTNALTAALQARHVPTFNFDAVLCQRVHVNKTIGMRKLSSFPGTAAATGMPPNTAVVMTKRTLTAGKRGRGSLHMSGIPSNIISAGEIDPAAIASYNTLKTELMAGRTISAVGMSIEPGLFHSVPFIPVFSRLFDVVLQTTIRTMRRRTVRVGI